MKNVWAAIFCLLLTVLGMQLFAQDEDSEEKRPWTDKAELGAVFTGGNSESSTFSFKNDYTYNWDNANFTFKMGGFRAESVTFTRFAVGTLTDFTVVEEETRQTTGEKYFLSLKYDRQIRKTLFWFTGLDWDRNEFAGIKNRYSGSAGLGNIWADSDERKFRTDYGVQYTREDLVFEKPGTDDSYASAIASYQFFQKVGKSSSFKQDFKANLNLDDTDDWRAELDNGFTTAITDMVALKVGLLFLFDNQPAFSQISLQNAEGEEVGKVAYELDELDTVFTTSLVINF